MVAVRKHLAAPVSKTGSASPRSERYRRLPPVWLRVECRRSKVESRIAACPPSTLDPRLSTCLRPVAQKQSIRPISGRPRSITARDDRPSLVELRLGEPLSKPSTKGNPMKPVLRYQSQLLFRKSYKPDRLIRIRLAARTIKVFRPTRAGLPLKFSPSS